MTLTSTHRAAGRRGKQGALRMACTRPLVPGAGIEPICPLSRAADFKCHPSTKYRHPTTAERVILLGKPALNGVASVLRCEGLRWSTTHRLRTGYHAYDAARG